jgi:hypothetical protein
MNFQPIAAYFLPDGWSIGYSGNILANWKAAKDGDTWTVPFGLSVAKVLKLGKLPVRIPLAGQYGSSPGYFWPEMEHPVRSSSRAT